MGTAEVLEREQLPSWADEIEAFAHANDTQVPFDLEDLAHYDPAALVGNIEDYLHEQSEPLDAKPIDQMVDDSQRIYDEHARWLGSIVTKETVEPPEERATLLDQGRLAAEGSPEARAGVRVNLMTAAQEAYWRVEHHMTTRSRMKDGQIKQGLLSHRQMYENTLSNGVLSETMRTWSHIESRNGFFIEEAAKEGRLEDHVVLVASMVPKNFSRERANKEKFFGDTMTLAFQMTTMEGDEVVTESAFAAGVTEPDGERHDLKALRRMYVHDLGIAEAKDWEDTDFVKAVVIPKSKVPEGLLHILPLYDKRGAEVTGKTMYWGQHKKPGDYRQTIQHAHERTEGLDASVDTMTDQFIGRVHTFEEPMDAIYHVYEMLKVQGPKAAATNLDIDPEVFGPESAGYIYEIRERVALGHDLVHDAQAQEALQKAQQTADIKGCPPAKLKELADEANGSKKSKELEDCDFVSKECPKCHKKDVKTIVRKGVYYGACGCHS